MGETKSDRTAPNCMECKGLQLELRATLLTEVTMVAAWTKAGVDFLAPLVWDGMAFLNSTTLLLIVSAAIWLLGCVLWFCGLVTQRAVDRGLSTCWVLAGTCYTVAVLFLSAPPTGEAGLSAVSTF